MKNLNSILLSIFLMFVLACSEPNIKQETSPVDSTNNVTPKDQFSEMKKLHEENMEGFTFKYGYINYDEDKYGFSNPGFLKIFKDNKLVYADSFEGEGDVNIELLGHHNLDGNKLVFRLNYGTEACDYAYTSKYYFANNEQFTFLKKCYSITGGDQYSSKFYEHFFPSDSVGQPNSILIVEGQIFHEKDQPDRFDTSYIKFANGSFKITKPTDNLSKVK